MIGTVSTIAILFNGFDPDKAIYPVLLHSLPGLVVGLLDLKPRVLVVAAGIAAFPIVLFVYLALFREVSGLWPIAMVLYNIVAAVPFLIGYSVGLFPLFIRYWKELPKE